MGGSVQIALTLACLVSVKSLTDNSGHTKPVASTTNVLMQNGIFRHKNQLMQIRPDYGSSHYQHSRVKRNSEQASNTVKEASTQAKSNDDRANTVTIPYLVANLPLEFGDDGQQMEHSPHCKYIWMLRLMTVIMMIAVVEVVVVVMVMVMRRRRKKRGTR